MRELIGWHGLFNQLPVASNKPAREHAFRDVIASAGAELVVLARSVQPLGGELAKALPRRGINIHRSVLPSFAGAKPYLQAHARGVKIIGAATHYVAPSTSRGGEHRAGCAPL